ncbi:MAG: hypothetical protein IPJ77_08760 [Planctomycetes bacterium]|nr:hypothetical protein [Planctomycetota bacterium]
MNPRTHPASRPLRRLSALFGLFAWLASATAPSVHAQTPPDLLSGCGSPQGRPLTLHDGDLAFAIRPPGAEPLRFVARATEDSAHPGVLVVQTSPLGPMLLMPGLVAGGEGYMLDVVGTGTTVPLAWSDPLAGYTGNVGNVGVDVVSVPAEGLEVGIDQGGAVGKLVVVHGKDPEGHNTLRLQVTSAGDIAFLQFFSLKIAWKGRRPDGTSDSGTFAGPTEISGNDRQPVNSDGSRTYVDSVRPYGLFPIRPPEDLGGGQRRYTMDDAPNMKNPRGMAALIESSLPGLTVTEVFFEMKVTTYVMLLGPGGGIPIARLDWFYKEQVVIDANTPAVHEENGLFYGENIGPVPPGSPFDIGHSKVKTGAEAKLEAGHQDAFQKFTGNPPDFSGAPNLPW